MLNPIEPSSTPSRAKLLCVDPGRVWSLWPLARGFIRRAVERTGLSDFEAIEAQVLASEQLLWLALDGRIIQAAATTQLEKAGSRKICVLVACAGRGDWPSLMTEIEAYAKAEGCTATRIYGRIGWKKVLENYKMTHVILERNFE